MLMRGNRTTKVNSDNFRAFRSENYPLLAEAGIHIKYNRAYIRYPDDPECKVKAMPRLDTRVSVLKIHPGITPQVVRNILCGAETRAVIMETYGSGNAPSKEWFLDIVREAIAMDKILVNVTQCLAGTVDMDLYATGKKLKDAGVIGCRDITVESALAKLFHLMGNHESNDEVREMLDMNLRGEISK